MSGRPRLFSEAKQVSVLVDAGDYEALRELVERKREETPDFTLGDLLRGYIRRCLPKRPGASLRLVAKDPGESRVRRLHALAGGVRRIAKELQASGGR